MLVRVSPGDLTLRSLNGREYVLPIPDFRAVSDLGVAPDGSRVVVCAVPNGGELPNALKGVRGDQSLFVADLGQMGWRKLAGAVAVAPVWSREGSRISFYTGNALCSVTAEGAEPQAVKLGRFQWAAPAHSYSPSGQRLAFCKWKSDSRYLAVCSTGGGEPHVYSVTCFHYDWLDEDRLVYNLSSGLRILDLGTGKTSGFLTDGRSLRKLPRFEVQSPELSTALERGPDLEIKNPQVVVDRVFFQLVARVGEQRVEAICSVSQGHDDYRQHWRRSTALIRQGQPLRWLSFGRSAERSRLIRDFQVLDRGAALVLRDEAYDADAKLREWRWLLVSEGSEVELPHGCVPAFRPCGPEFGVDLLPLSN